MKIWVIEIYQDWTDYPGWEIDYDRGHFASEEGAQRAVNVANAERQAKLDVYSRKLAERHAEVKKAEAAVVAAGLDPARFVPVGSPTFNYPLRPRDPEARVCDETIEVQQ